MKSKIKKMNIKNFSSTVDPSNLILKIQELLVEIGASDITMKYENKVCTVSPFFTQIQSLVQP